jgi:hypothetical protein
MNSVSPIMIKMKTFGRAKMSRVIMVAIQIGLYNVLGDQFHVNRERENHLHVQCMVLFNVYDTVTVFNVPKVYFIGIGLMQLDKDAYKQVRIFWL